MSVSRSRVHLAKYPIFRVRTENTYEHPPRFPFSTIQGLLEPSFWLNIKLNLSSFGPGAAYTMTNSKWWFSLTCRFFLLSVVSLFFLCQRVLVYSYCSLGGISNGNSACL